MSPLICVVGSGTALDDTTDVGTVLDLPPAQEAWSDKIDMYDNDIHRFPSPSTLTFCRYALGITMMELFTCFSTGMERFTTLGKLRRPSPEFPPNFERTHFEAAIMMRRLLQRNPDRRPSAQDMLTMVY
jgi:hypothetical protein